MLPTLHSVQQFGATMFMMGNIDSAFAPLLAIQIAAFLMTLIRKSIISELDWHRLYAISLWLNIFVYWSFNRIDKPIYIIMGVYLFDYLRVNQVTINIWFGTIYSLSFMLCIVL